MQNKMIGFYVQKFDGDSTIVYSIEEDDQDILTMTAMIGDTFSPKLISERKIHTVIHFPQNLFPRK